MIFWCDLETTGFTELDTDGVKRHKILEIAVVVTNDKFNLLTIGSWVIHHDKEDLLGLMDDVVLKMHTDNGLLDKVEESTVTLAQAEQEILALLNRLKVQPKTAPLAGNTIFLDRAFIEAQMPELNAHLHYRNLDVSATYELVKRVCKGFVFPKKKNHRGTDDILESIAEAKFYAEVLQSSRDVIRQGPQPDEYDFRSM